MTALFEAIMSLFGGSSGASAAGSAASGAAGSAGTAATGSALGEAAGSTLAQGAAQGVANAAPAVVQNAAPAAVQTVADAAPVAASTSKNGITGLLNSLGKNEKTLVQASGFGNQLKDITDIEKAYKTITDSKLSLHDKFNTLAPMAYEQNEKNKVMFAQLQQGAIPQPMNMQQLPSYAQPSMPYQGGGIEEILSRQRGLLR